MAKKSSDKKREKQQISHLKQTQKVEIRALKQSGASKAQIAAEKKANSGELSKFKSYQSAPGVQTVSSFVNQGKPLTGMLSPAQTASSTYDPTQGAGKSAYDRVTNTVQTLDKYGMSAAVGDSDKGRKGVDLVKLDKNIQSFAKTGKYTDSLLGRSLDRLDDIFAKIDSGQPVTREDLAYVKKSGKVTDRLKPVKGQPGVYQVKYGDRSGEKQNYMTEYWQENADGSFSPISVDKFRVSPESQGGLGALGGLLGAGLGFALGPLGFGLMGATGAGALGGAVGGGLASGDLKGALTGGLLGGLGGGMFGVDSAIAADAAQLAGQGLSSSQIASTLGQTWGTNAVDSFLASLGGQVSNTTGSLLGNLTGGSTPTTGGGTAALPLDQVNALQGGQNMDFFDTLDTLLQGGYSNVDAWNMAEQLTGGQQLGSMVDSFIAGEAVAPSWFNSVVDTVKNALGPNATQSAISAGVKSLLGGGTATGVLGSLSGLLGTGANLLGGYLQGEQSAEAAQKLADAQIEAAKIAADAAKFRPVGVTTRFGQSKFGYDANGNLTSAGYTLDPMIKAQQDKLMAESGGLLNQYLGANEATAPMGTAAQRAMQLGNSYLATSPQEQAKKYMAEQQALLATGRERDISTLQNKLLQQGRLGLATGGTSTGMMAANPEMEAYYNALRQQDLGLAAQATQGGMDYAKFGAGMVGTGGDLLNSMYATQSAAYNPYKTAIGGAQYLEGLGQNAMDMGINLGAKGTAANAASGSLLATGMQNAAQTMAPVDSYSPWARLLGNIGDYLTQPAQTGQMNQAFKYDPYSGKLLGA